MQGGSAAIRGKRPRNDIVVGKTQNFIACTIAEFDFLAAIVEITGSIRTTDSNPGVANGKGRWMLGICRYTSLAALGQILATPGIIPGMEIDRALNFDGGKSTGLWLRTAAGAEVYESEIATVRNFVTIEPRQ